MSEEADRVILPPIHPAKTENWITGYFRTLWQILTQPYRFFSNLDLEGGSAGPLAFAVVTMWIASFAQYSWAAMIGGAASRYFEGFFKAASDIADVDSPGRGALLLHARDQFTNWAMGAGAVLLDPFMTLVSILFVALFIFVGARLLVSPERKGLPFSIRYEGALKIVCYGKAPAILACIPILGPAFAKVVAIIVTVVGAKAAYRIGTGRALAVVLFPYLLLFGIIMSVGLVFIVAFIELVAKMF